jgi:antitoxin HicB
MICPDASNREAGVRAVWFVYPYTVRQSDDGAWQVRFRDVPEALTEGDTEAEAHALATDVLVAALGGLAGLRRDLPTPSRPAKADFVVVVPMLQSAKLALYQAMREHGLNTVTLARKLGVQESEVRRMLDLDHQTKIGTLERALWQLGKQIATEIRKVA